MATDDIDVLIEEDKPLVETEIVVAPAGEAAAKPKIIEPDEGLEELKANLERERTGRLAAEAQAREASAREATAKTEVQDTNLSLVTNAIETVKQSSDVLKGRYRDAMSAGDFDAAADIQTDMATNAARLLRLEEGKIALETAPKPVAQISDPVERFAAQCTPLSAAWIRAHPQFATDRRQNRDMIRAHEDALEEGFRLESPAYFAAIEDKLNLTRRQEVAETDDALSGAAEPTQRRAAPAAAPVSRTGTGNGQRANTVRLNAAQREIAALNGLTDEEYARNLITLQREGRMQ